MSQQDNKVQVVINKKTILEYDRSKTTGQEQLAFFERMNHGIKENGIDFAGQHYDKPDINIQAQAVAQDMIMQLINKEYEKASAMFAWLGHHLPSLRTVMATVSPQEAHVEMKFKGAAA